MREMMNEAGQSLAALPYPLIKFGCVAEAGGGEATGEQRGGVGWGGAGRTALLLRFLNALSDKALLERPPKL